MASTIDQLKSLFQKAKKKTLDATTIDERLGQGLRSVGDRAFNVARVTDNRLRNNLQQNAGTRSYGQAFGKSFLDTPQTMYDSLQKTGITKPFGNLVRSTVTPLSAGAGNYFQGVNTATTAQGGLAKLKGGLQALKGGGQVAAGINPLTYAATSANTLLPQGVTKRLLTGGLRGFTQTGINPETEAKNINTPLGSFDPVMGIGEMVGFVKNPVNAKLFKGTEKLLPTAKKTVGAWLGSNSIRGAIEQIALDLPEMPDNMNAGQKAEWLAKTIGIGAVSELVGQGVMQGSGKVLKKVGDTKLGKVTQEQASKLFDYLATARRRNTIPVRRSLTETVPMWREKLSIKRTNTPEDKRVLSQMGYGSQSAAGGLAGAEPYQDENGNWKMRFNPEKAALGIAAMGGIKAIKNGKLSIDSSAKVGGEAPNPAKIKQRLAQELIDVDSSDTKAVRGSFVKAGYVEVDGFLVHPSVDAQWVKDLSPETKQLMKDKGITYIDNATGGQSGVAVERNLGGNKLRGIAVRSDAEIGSNAFTKKDAVVAHEVGHFVWRDLTPEQQAAWTKEHPQSESAYIDRLKSGEQHSGGSIAEENFSENYSKATLSSTPLEALQTEARKYKSAEEFIKAVTNRAESVAQKVDPNYDYASNVSATDGYKAYQRETGGLDATKLANLYNQATTPKGVGATQKVPIKNPVDTQSLDQGRVALLQDQGSIPIKKAEVVTQPVQPTNTQSIPVRTSVPRASSKRSIAGNPIKDDITGVNPSGIVTKLRESVQDNWIRVKNLQRQKGVKLDETSNPYLAEELYHGRVGTRIEDVKAQIVEYDKDLLATSKKINLPDAQLKADVNKYLQAKHAPERNKLHGDGAAGMTNAEARAYLKELGASPASAEVKRLSAKVKQMNDETLDVLLESQVIDKTLYDTLRKTYKNHVPLNRIMDDSNLDAVLTGKGFNVKSSGVKKAKGSSREVADILGNVVANLESAIVRAEKNRVNLATLRFARNNKQLGIFSEIKPKAIGQTFDGKFITQEVKDPLVLTVRENGKPVYLRIADEQLAPVFQGIGNEKLPSAFKFIQKFTQFYSGLHTRFNPEFAASNVIRDTQEMAVFMASQKDVGFKGAGRTITRIPEAQRAVIDGIRGLDSEGARLYRQMKLDGGTTGGMALSTRKSVDVDLKQIEQLNRSKPRQAVQKVLESFDNWNTIFEDATRLSVYKQALENGMSRQQAASLAKNSTVNFNKKGTATPIINSLYMFSNASVQGSVKMLRAMKNPKVAAAVVTTVGSSVFAANSWNDTVDPDWRDKVTEWDRNSNLVVMLPSTDGGAKYITVPVSWGIKPIKVASDVAYDLSVGKADNIGDAAIKIASSAFDAYNPVGGEDMTSALTPSILDTPFDIARNRSWSGATIKPDWLKGLPASEQMFANTGNTTTGKIAIKTTQALAGGGIQVSPNDLLYAYNSYIGGVGKFASRVTDTVSAIATSESLVAKEIPFANRFFKTRSEEQVQMSGIFKGQDNFMKSLQKYETGSAEQATAIKNYLRGLGSDKERQSMLFKLRDQGIPTKGISYSGKKLGATNVPLKSEKVSFQQTTDQPQNILDKVALAAQGLTKDPENTIKAIFTQEELRKIEGNAVILKRQEFLNKENDPNLQRDHIIPLALGGDNSEENLKYIPKEYHAEKTKNDNRLIRELQSGKITREEAQAQVSAWIEANPHETYVMEEQPKQDDSFINQDFAIEYTKSDGTTDVKVVRVEVPEYPTLTGQAELDKKLKSAYYSKLTTAKNNTLKLYEAGKITAEEAEEILDSLDTKQKKASGRKGKKAKKIKIGSTPTLKRVSIKAPQVSQMAKIDFKIPTSQRVPIRNASTSKPRIKLKDASKRLLSVVR